MSRATSLLVLLPFALQAACRDNQPIAEPRSDIVAAPAAEARGAYTVTDLGTLGGGTLGLPTVPGGITDKSTVVGSSPTADGRRHAFSWSKGVMTDLSASASEFATSRADAANDRGVVAGVSQPEGDARWATVWTNGVAQTVGPGMGPPGNGRAIEITNEGEVLMQVWVDHSDIDAFSALSRNGGFAEIPSLRGPGRSGVRAWAMNRSRTVVGTSWVGERDGTDYFHAFIWDGATRELPPLGAALCPDTDVSECYQAQALDINDRGVAVGFSSVATSPRFFRPVMWTNGSVRALGDIEGRAVAINDHGLVAIVGLTDRTPNGSGYVWDGGSLQNIGSLGGGGTIIRGLNKHGMVVGNSRTAGGATHAFVWHRGVMTDLGVFGSDASSSAIAINDRGDIIGTSGVCQPDGTGFCSAEGRAVIWQK